MCGILCLILIYGLIGCSKKEPDLLPGFSSQEIYDDMMECTVLARKTLGTKNTAYIDAIGELLNKYIDSQPLPDANLKDVLIKNPELTDTENDILYTNIYLYFSLRQCFVYKDQFTDEELNNIRSNTFTLVEEAMSFLER